MVVGTLLLVGYSIKVHTYSSNIRFLFSELIFTVVVYYSAQGLKSVQKLCSLRTLIIDDMSKNFSVWGTKVHDHGDSLKLNVF